MRGQISIQYTKQLNNNGYVEPEKLRNNVLGIEEKEHSLLTYFTEHNLQYKDKVGTTATQKTYSRYELTKQRLIDFMKVKYRVSDILIREINTIFIENFYLYLRNDWKGKLYSLYSESIQCILNEFALLHQRLEIEKYTEEQFDLLFRHNDLLNKVLYHVLLDTTLACNKFERQEPVVKERLILYCLNIIDKCGLPNGGLIDYLEKLSTANGNTFYPQHVLKMLNEILAVSREGKYKRTGKLGICKIESIQGSKYQIKTIYGQGYSHVDKKEISDFVLSKVPIKGIDP